MFVPSRKAAPQADALPPTTFPIEAPPATEADVVSAQQGFSALVSMTDRGFEPAALSIQQGETVRFTNNSNSQIILTGPSSLNILAQPIFAHAYREIAFKKSGTYEIQNAATGATISVAVQ